MSQVESIMGEKRDCWEDKNKAAGPMASASGRRHEWHSAASSFLPFKSVHDPSL